MYSAPKLEGGGSMMPSFRLFSALCVLSLSACAGMADGGGGSYVDGSIVGWNAKLQPWARIQESVQPLRPIIGNFLLPQ